MQIFFLILFPVALGGCGGGDSKQAAVWYLDAGCGLTTIAPCNRCFLRSKISLLVRQDIHSALFTLAYISRWRSLVSCEESKHLEQMRKTQLLPLLEAVFFLLMHSVRNEDAESFTLNQLWPSTPLTQSTDKWFVMSTDQFQINYWNWKNLSAISLTEWCCSGKNKKKGEY